MIRWARGTRVFGDTGVVAGELGGTAYEYCGRVLGYHLIRKADEGLFTGVLLDTQRGRSCRRGNSSCSRPMVLATSPLSSRTDTFRYLAAGVLLWLAISPALGRYTHRNAKAV